MVCSGSRISIGERYMRAGNKPCQLSTSKLVGLPVRLPSFAPPTRKPHARSFLRVGFLRWLSRRESEGLVRCPLTPGLADGQPVPPTASGPVGRIFVFGSESDQAYALPPRANAGGLSRCYRCDYSVCRDAEPDCGARAAGTHTVRPVGVSRRSETRRCSVGSTP